mgnify:CR=1 FL=1
MPLSRPHRVLAVVLAGGRGERLQPLTRHRSKPAVPFGGRYRIVDFVLSNLVNSGISAIYILTQYKAQSLISHIQRAWWFVGGGLDSFATVVPAQMQLGDAWYRGTADAIYQNLNLIEEYGADAVAVFGADHIYKMNIGQMVDYHFEHGAEATVACMPLTVAESAKVGVADCDANGRIRAFVEKRTGRTEASEVGAGTLFSSGLIAGGSLAGILYAVLFGRNIIREAEGVTGVIPFLHEGTVGMVAGALLFFALSIVLARAAQRKIM